MPLRSQQPSAGDAAAASKLPLDGKRHVEFQTGFGAGAGSAERRAAGPAAAATTPPAPPRQQQQQLPAVKREERSPVPGPGPEAAGSPALATAGSCDAEAAAAALRALCGDPAATSAATHRCRQLQQQQRARHSTPGKDGAEAPGSPDGRPDALQLPPLSPGLAAAVALASRPLPALAKPGNAPTTPTGFLAAQATAADPPGAPLKPGAASAAGGPGSPAAGASGAPTSLPSVRVKPSAGRGSSAAAAAGPHRVESPPQGGSVAAQHRCCGSNRGVSAYNGVSWDKRKQRWFSQIQQHGRRHFLGYYGSEQGAAAAYDRAALRLYGDAAQLNLPDSAAGGDSTPSTTPTAAAAHAGGADHRSSSRSGDAGGSGRQRGSGGGAARRGGLAKTTSDAATASAAGDGLASGLAAAAAAAAGEQQTAQGPAGVPAPAKPPTALPPPPAPLAALEQLVRLQQLHVQEVQQQAARQQLALAAALLAGQQAQQGPLALDARPGLLQALSALQGAAGSPGAAPAAPPALALDAATGALLHTLAGQPHPGVQQQQPMHDLLGLLAQLPLQQQQQGLQWQAAPVAAGGAPSKQAGAADGDAFPGAAAGLELGGRLSGCKRGSTELPAAAWQGQQPEQPSPQSPAHLLSLAAKRARLPTDASAALPGGAPAARPCGR